MEILNNKVVVITGGTGSLGKVLTRRLLKKELGSPKKIIIFSRDEAKQHAMRIEYQSKQNVTDEVIYDNFARLIEFRIGDIRDYHSVCSVLREADIVINAAALKQVPSCEYFPFEAVLTNIVGAENIIRAIRENDLKVDTVVGVSTDKACKPVNAMGISKALQERIFIAANVTLPKTRFICVRYGNVLASRGSVIPLFHEQIKRGGPVTITTKEMTRFLLPLESAVDTIFAVLKDARPGEIFIPKIPAALIEDVAKALMGEQTIAVKYTGIRPGEKVHEIMISEEEAWRTYDRGEYYAIKPMLPELLKEDLNLQVLSKEYSSGDSLMTFEDTLALLRKHNLMIGQENRAGEFLR
ncbi:polysaccharide biosynthesis protein [Desulfosporosinus meridiei]|uniref:Putative nucleoside-diphosphate sugar epimerase n=1 Tax=Desulfosporosinus meridiei (strain ATCC BAA-275 / DSM 13257 / KCTC 12902 / NCIMB 13706 / S10) TaxID=768704 RepID=J7IUM1_DESMD|nr:polysaccharide biosynthesis protein [Desulfosporosinus meridiei]AFQ42396.1 putative nucleoside-diphosphate sugar epimerase [Desulfosporosinus meridiei DSM 13257]